MYCRDISKEKYIVNPLYPYTCRRTELALRRLCLKYGDVLSACVADSSTQGRNIYLLRLGKGKRKILVAGGIHGREYVTTGYLLRCAEEYCRGWYEGKPVGGLDVQGICEEFTFVLMPDVNPDSSEIALGRAYPLVRRGGFCARTFKNNANDVNINANFPFVWASVPERRQGGAHPASEKETKVLMRICESQDFECLLTFHSRGNCIYYRDAGNGRVEGDLEIARRLERCCGFSLCPPTEKAEDYAGGFENWFRSRFRRAALCIELITDENAPFEICCRDFYRLTNWDLSVSALLNAAQVLRSGRA